MHYEEAGYRALFEGAADGVLVADDAGNYTDANPAAARMFGVDRDDLIGRGIADFVIEDDDDLLDHWNTFVSSEGDSGRVRIRRGDGDVIVCDYNATTNFVPGRHLSILRDVTELVEMQQQREQSEDRFRRMLDALGLLALIIDVEGRTTFMNRAMLSMLGVEPEQVLGERLTDAQPDGDAQHTAFIEAIASEEITPAWENEVLAADGSRRHIRWTSAFIRDARGRVEAVASIGEDITERRRLEEQVRQAMQVESLGRLAGGVAHEFNNLLTIMLAHAEMLMAVPELTSGSRDHIGHITAGIDSAARLTRQLLAFGRQQVMEARDVSIGRALDHVRNMLAPTLGPDIAIEVVEHVEDVVVFIDPFQLDQVLVDLAMNAHDAMPQGGTLRFEVTARDVDDADAEPLGLTAARYAILTVSDTGVGIPADVLDHIFEPFVTTKPVGVGTLGLAMAYGIITQSGGAIEVTSRRGHGTTFTVHLPIRQPQMAAPRADASTVRAESAERTPAPAATVDTVLIVEDDHRVRTVTEQVLAHAGYDTEAYESPLRALEAISRKTPSLVLTDIMMPELDGFEFAERVRSIDAGIPVLFMSGYVDADRWTEIRSTNEAIALVSKPFTTEQLLTSVTMALGHDTVG